MWALFISRFSIKILNIYLHENFVTLKTIRKLKMKKYFFITISAVLLTLGGCASPTVVQSVKPGDAGLSCAQLQNEYADADKLKKSAAEEKGVTGGNVARLLFWPSIIGTYMNANEAIAAADNRMVNLANLMSRSKCPVPSLPQ
jgi:hypothetical protein